MNDACRRFDTLIARTAHLTKNEAELLEAHLAGCAACRELSRAMKPIDSDIAFTETMAETMGSQSGEPTSAADRHRPPGADTKDRYRITGEGGRGGLGRVMEALDKVLDRPVAIKELFSENATLRRRFVREALITARLQHPSIVPVYDVGHLGDQSPFYAMKLVAGQPLDKAVAEAGTLTRRLALLPRVLAVADAMAYAHSKRVIHRDLKPANILLGAFGETIVIDWGLAKDLAVADEDARDAGPYRAVSADHTMAGAMMGTPAFMAPEQAAAATVDERADVYALGSILYHVVTGTAPLHGTTLEEMIRRVTTGDVVAVTEREPEVPRDLAAIVAKAMALAPDDRYANAGGLAEELRRFLTGQLVRSHSYGVRELLRRWVKRHRAAVAVAVAALACIAVIGTLSVRRVVQARHHADEQRAIAEREKVTATETLASLFEEQGRQELLAGRPARAATFLSEAYGQARRPGAGLRTLLAEAMRSLEADLRTFQGDSDEIAAADLSRDGKRLVTAGLDEVTRVWDTATGAEVATLTGHDDEVLSVALSPDGVRVATASADLTARLWDASTGALRATLEHPSHVLVAAFSPDGARLLTAGEAGAARLWDTASAKLIAALEGHRGNVAVVAFSADGARAVTAGADPTAKVWATDAGKLVATLEGHRGEILAAAFRPDGAALVTASDDGTARLWNATTGALLATLAGHRGPVHAAAYSPDGARVLTASDDRTAKLWDATSGAVLASLEGHSGAVVSAAFSPDGTLVVTASDDRTAKLWDAATGELLASYEGHRNSLRSARFTPDGAQILTVSNDGTAKLWQVTARRVRWAPSGAAKPARVALSPDGSKLATIAAAASEVELWDARSGERLATLRGHSGEVAAVAFDAAGARVVTSGADRTAKVWDATTGALLHSLEHPAAVASAAFSADGARLVTSSEGPRLWIWSAASGELLGKFAREGAEQPVRLSKDGTRILIANLMGRASIRRVDTGETLVELEGDDSPIYAAAFSPDGERLLTMSIDWTAKVWNARTGKPIASLEGVTQAVFGSSFSRDGARVLTMSADNTAKLWDASTGKLLASYEGHQGAILNASFSPDDARVLTVSGDRTATLWDASTGKLLASLGAPTSPGSLGSPGSPGERGEGELFEGAFSRDGSRVTTASSDGVVEIWDVHLEARDPDELRRVVAERSLWTLANGVLVPDKRRGNR